MQVPEQADYLREEFQAFHHEIACRGTFESAANHLLEWDPDVLITDESFGRSRPDAGFELSLINLHVVETRPGNRRFNAIVLMPHADPARYNRIRRIGAHPRIKALGLDQIVRYVQVIADDLITDRILGPVLVAYHGFPGTRPHAQCTGCKYLGSTIFYGPEPVDVKFAPRRALLFNALMFHRRGQTREELFRLVAETPFLRTLQGKGLLTESSLKEEISRIRDDFGEYLGHAGVPQGRNHYVPLLDRNFPRYQLAGSWQLVHVPLDENAMLLQHGIL